VTDTGSGMDPATCRRATEPFFTTKEIGRGTGLGLSMVEGLVAQSGGALRLQSALGEGTSVELWLPAMDAAQAHPPVDPGKAELPAARRCRVLVVDDDPLVLAGVIAMLDDLGHDVIEANSAAAALERLARDSDFDLVITDHAMPTMSGMELLRQIRRTWPSLPIVLSSGFAEFSGSEDSGVPRLMKPFRQEELAALIVKLAPPEFRTPGFAATA
jgi:CheY-like chemotaxis protein